MDEPTTHRSPIVGTTVRITNRASHFYGRLGRLYAYVGAEGPSPCVTVSLCPTAQDTARTVRFALNECESTNVHSQEARH